MREIALLWFGLRVDTTQVPGGVRAAENELKQSMMALAGAASAMYGAIYAAGRSIFGKGLDAAADFEKTTVEMETMIGTAEETADTLARLTQFAVETPFEMPQLLNVTRQLITFGERGDELFGTLKMLGDASGGTNEKFQLLGSVFNQVRGAGKLLTQDFRQLSGRGIISLKDIEKYYKVSTQAANKMLSDGKISFGDFKKILKSTTEEGGRFANMMAKTSLTMEGLSSTLKDSIAIAQRMVATPLLPYMKGLTIAAIQVANTLGAIAKAGGEMVSFAGVAVTGVSGFMVALGAGRLVMNLFGFAAVSMRVALMAAIRTFLFSVAPLLLLAAAIGATVGWFVRLKIVQDGAIAIWTAVADGLDRVTAVFNKLWGTVKFGTNVSIVQFSGFGRTVRAISHWFDVLIVRCTALFYTMIPQIIRISELWFALGDNLARVMSNAITAIGGYWGSGTTDWISMIEGFIAWAVDGIEWLVDQFVFWTTDIGLSWELVCNSLYMVWLAILQSLVEGLYSFAGVFVASIGYVAQFFISSFYNMAVTAQWLWETMLAYGNYGVSMLSDVVYNIYIEFKRTFSDIAILFQAMWAGIKNVASSGGFSGGFQKEFDRLQALAKKDPALQFKEVGAAGKDELDRGLKAASELKYVDVFQQASDTFTSVMDDFDKAAKDLGYDKALEDAADKNRLITEKINEKKETDALNRRLAKAIRGDDPAADPAKKKKGGTPDASVNLAQGRYGFSEIGNKIQDELLKGTSDTPEKQLAAAEMGNEIAKKQLTATEKMADKVGGVGE